MPLAFSLLGLGIFLWRLWPRRMGDDGGTEPIPPLTLIVPCRNEEKNIPRLLESLAGFPHEILVVDDSSTDRTAEAAARFKNVTVIQAPPKPAGWVGKSWACWIGARQARGEFLLFTDADTIHRSGSWRTAWRYLEARKADFISAPPFHRCLNGFEKGLGLFHAIPLVITAFQAAPDSKRLFAIGQYLLFRKNAYFEMGGHEAVRGSLAEDIDIATAGLKSGLRYAVFPRAGLYEVQMYNSPGEFWRGWVRLLRLGMKRSTPLAFVETAAVFHLFTNWNPALGVGLAALLFLQPRHGSFSAWGILFAPLNVVVFVAMCISAAFQMLSKQEIVWHDRSYVDS